LCRRRIISVRAPFARQSAWGPEVTVRNVIWQFYQDLKCYRSDPSKPRKAALRARFDRIFKRENGFITLDRLLARLHANTGGMVGAVRTRKCGMSMSMTKPKATKHLLRSNIDDWSDRQLW